MFSSNLWETLNIRYIFVEGKESARKTKKAKFNEALLRIVLKKHQSDFLNKTSV